MIDHDPASGLFYHPVDLDDPVLLAQNGLPPSEGRPQFHQQMVYAVAMKTVRAFERALGRTIYWTRDWPTPPPELEAQGLESAAAPPATFDDVTKRPWDLVARLRIYPHALRERNAYYSPQKTAILFGYFQPADRTLGDRWVFTCLSQDIIAHETTHALLHGV
ncbi:peptidase S8, partial [bacterium]